MELKRKVCWFDLETSGLDPQVCGIVQAAFLIEVNGKIVEEKVFEADPRKSGFAVDSKALEVTGLSPEDLDPRPDCKILYREIKALFNAFVNPYDKEDKFIPAGLNIATFDLPFLRALWTYTKDPYFMSFFHAALIDPKDMIAVMYAKGDLDTMPLKLRLGDLAAALKVPLPKAHDALNDIRATRTLARRLLEGSL